MKKNLTILVVGGMNSGKIAALTEIELDANRKAMLQNAGKMEVGTYGPIENIKTAFEDFGKSLKAVSIRLGDLDIETPKTNQKWYNQFPKRKRK